MTDKSKIKIKLVPGPYTTEDRFRCETYPCPDAGKIIGLTPDTFVPGPDTALCPTCGAQMEEDYTRFDGVLVHDAYYERAGMGLCDF